MQESLSSILAVFEQTKTKLTNFVGIQKSNNAEFKQALKEGEQELVTAQKALKQVNKILGK